MSQILPGISVIICCYNSANRLPETLSHLALQEFKQHINWQVIVVDNASTDNTFNVAIKEGDKHTALKDRLQVVNQPIQGLSYARDMGIATAKFKYVVFCDDDNWLNTKYLNNAYHLMENNPKIGALGGQSVAATDAVILPDWFNLVKNWYAVGQQGKKSGDISHRYNVWGAGMVTKKELHLKCFPHSYPSYLTDRKGDNLSSGGDTEFCLRLLLKGYILYYDESLRFTHFIPKQRLTPVYRDRLEKGFSESISKLFKYSQLCDMKDKNLLSKFIIFSKTFLGYISSVFGRKSYQLENVKIAFFYLTKIDKMVDDETKKVYSFYKNYHFKLENI